MSIKKLAVLIFVFGICGFVRTETVWADDNNSESLIIVDEEDLTDGWDITLVETEGIQISDEGFFAAARSGSYEVVPYSRALIIGYGYDYVVATLGVYGDAYFYETGQVHLYRMRIQVNHIDGCTYSVDSVEIKNTDGSLSTGTALVDITYKSETARYLCTVTLTGGSTDIDVKFYRIF